MQILGAENALFRALNTKSKTPKYGLLYHSTFIGRAKAKNKGRISRYLANKCSIASRMECFSETSSDVCGRPLDASCDSAYARRRRWRWLALELREPDAQNVDLFLLLRDSLLQLEDRKDLHAQQVEYFDDRRGLR